LNRKVIEAGLFTGIAVFAHVLVFARAPEGAPEAAGTGGGAALSLRAAPEVIAAAVDTWETPPVIAESLPPAPPVAPMETPPAAEAGARLDDFAPAAAPTPLPVPPQTPETFSQPLPPPEPPEERPLTAAVTPPPPRPEALVTAARQRQPSEARQAQAAAGAGGSVAAGRDGPAEISSLSATRRSSLLGSWGAEIRSRIERRKRAIRGTSAGGTATVRLMVAADGRLLGLALAQSSGSPELDQAALDAVRRAGRFGPAPAQLGLAQHAFALPIRFDG
jgi:periplasmic protein TonB